MKNDGRRINKYNGIVKSYIQEGEDVMEGRGVITPNGGGDDIPFVGQAFHSDDDNWLYVGQRVSFSITDNPDSNTGNPVLSAWNIYPE